MKKLLFLFPLLLLFNSCHRCESENLPIIFVTFHSMAMPDYKRVYNQYVEFSREEFNDRLPISLNSDTTTFYFKTAEGEVDTLSIRYKRSSVFENTGCGFLFSVMDPELLPATTFSGAVVELNAGDVGVQL